MWGKAVGMARAGTAAFDRLRTFRPTSKVKAWKQSLDHCRRKMESFLQTSGLAKMLSASPFAPRSARRETGEPTGSILTSARQAGSMPNSIDTKLCLVGNGYSCASLTPTPSSNTSASAFGMPPAKLGMTLLATSANGRGGNLPTLKASQCPRRSRRPLLIRMKRRQTTGSGPLHHRHPGLDPGPMTSLQLRIPDQVRDDERG